MVIRDNIVAKYTEKGVVLRDLSNRSIFTGNLVGARVWTKLVEGLSVDEIVDAIVAEFTVPREQVAVDVEDCIKSLEDNGLIAKT